MTYRVLVADDEALARDELKALLGEVDWLECVAETSNGPDTIQAIDEQKPDLIFLDVEMPGATGLEVLRQVEHNPQVIFTTAYDQYAVTAFELQALDYLLKPFGAERFNDVLKRAREALDAGRAGRDPWEMDGPGHPEDPLRRVFVRERGRIIPIRAKDIRRLEAMDDYVMVHHTNGRNLVRVRMKDFEARLDPERFTRIHRTHLINLDYVCAFTSHDGTRLAVEMEDGTRLVASRSHSKRLRKRVI